MHSFERIEYWGDLSQFKYFHCEKFSVSNTTQWPLMDGSQGEQKQAPWGQVLLLNSARFCDQRDCHWIDMRLPLAVDLYLFNVTQVLLMVVAV